LNRHELLDVLLVSGWPFVAGLVLGHGDYIGFLFFSVISIIQVSREFKEGERH